MPRHVTYCCVFGCRSKKNHSITFHMFPKAGRRNVQIPNMYGEKELMDQRAAWELLLKMEKKASNRQSVCNRHFSEDCYILPGFPTQKKRLKMNAVPDQNLPQFTKTEQLERMRTGKGVRNSTKCLKRGVVPSVCPVSPRKTETCSRKTVAVQPRVSKSEELVMEDPELSEEEEVSEEDPLLDENDDEVDDDDDEREESLEVPKKSKGHVSRKRSRSDNEKSASPEPFVFTYVVPTRAKKGRTTEEEESGDRSASPSSQPESPCTGPPSLELNDDVVSIIDEPMDDDDDNWMPSSLKSTPLQPRKVGVNSDDEGDTAPPMKKHQSQTESKSNTDRKRVVPPPKPAIRKEGPSRITTLPCAAWLAKEAALSSSGEDDSSSEMLTEITDVNNETQGVRQRLQSIDISSSDESDDEDEIEQLESRVKVLASHLSKVRDEEEDLQKQLKYATYSISRLELKIKTLQDNKTTLQQDQKKTLENAEATILALESQVQTISTELVKRVRRFDEDNKLKTQLKEAKWLIERLETRLASSI